MPITKDDEETKLNPPVDPTPKVPEPEQPQAGQLAAKPEVKEEMVTLPKSTIDRLMAFMETSTKQIERLTAAADTKRLNNYDLKNQGVIVRKVLLSTIDGKILFGWRMTKNEVFQDINGRWHEDQAVEVVFEDNNKKEMPYKPDYLKAVQKIEAEIVSQFTTPEGFQMMRLRIVDPKSDTGTRELDIDQTFVN